MMVMVMCMPISRTPGQSRKTFFKILYGHFKLLYNDGLGAKKSYTPILCPDVQPQVTRENIETACPNIPT